MTWRGRRGEWNGTSMCTSPQVFGTEIFIISLPPLTPSPFSLSLFTSPPTLSASLSLPHPFFNRSSLLFSSLLALSLVPYLSLLSSFVLHSLSSLLLSLSSISHLFFPSLCPYFSGHHQQELLHLPPNLPFINDSLTRSSLSHTHSRRSTPGHVLSTSK